VEDDQLFTLTAGMERAYEALRALKDADAAAIVYAGNSKLLAQAYCNSVVPAMAKLRREVDALETMTSAEFWPVPTYADLMFRQKGKI
jgi:glutamine synthetase